MVLIAVTVFYKSLQPAKSHPPPPKKNVIITKDVPTFWSLLLNRQHKWFSKLSHNFGSKNRLQKELKRKKKQWVNNFYSKMYERIYVQRCCIDNLDCEWQWQDTLHFIGSSSLQFITIFCWNLNFCCNGRVTNIQNNEAWRRTSV